MALSQRVTASWALAQTATDIVGVSVGMLEAATTDNVQALALIACEAFGGTLAMSVESKAKVNQLCSQDKQSPLVNFFKAKVGYKKGDSGWQLAHSDAGLRFLGLAACLLSQNLWTSAEILQELITETAENRTLTPTVHQLKALLLALQYRLEKAGFADNVIGNSLWLNDMLDTQCDGPGAPSSTVISRLIKTMSRLARLGEEVSANHTMKVTVPPSRAAWTISFIKWCLGHPPTVVGADGIVLLRQDKCQAFVHLLESEDEDSIAISLWGELKSPIELFQGMSNGLRSIHGMISIRCFAEDMLSLFGTKSSPLYRNALELLPYALRLAYSELKVGPEGMDFSKDSDADFADPQECFVTDNIHAQYGTVFPEEDAIRAAAQTFLNSDRYEVLRDLPQGLPFNELPTATATEKLLRLRCHCKSCRKPSDILSPKCEFDVWLYKMSACVGTILLISLLVPIDPEGVLLRYRFQTMLHHQESPRGGMITAIYNSLRGYQKTQCTLTDVIDTVLYLVGHQLEEDLNDLSNSNTWIASAHLGQVLYPAIIQSVNIQNRGSLMLICAPGSLTWDNTTYNFIEKDFTYPRQHEIAVWTYDDIEASIPLPSTIVPENWYTTHKLRWEVSAEERSLRLRLVCSGFSKVTYIDPMDAVLNATISMFVTCSHDIMTPCSTDFMVRGTPGNPCGSTNPKGIGIVQTDRNHAMRFLAMCTKLPCVIRSHACLECCLMVAKLFDFPAILC